MALTVRIQKYCKYVFIEFISFAFFALFVIRQALFIFLFVCFHCSENHVHIHIHIQRFTSTEIVSTRCRCRILNLCVFEAIPIFTDFSQRLGATSSFSNIYAFRFGIFTYFVFEYSGCEIYNENIGFISNGYRNLHENKPYHGVYSYLHGQGMSSGLNQMDSQSEKDKFEAVTSQAEDRRTENVLEDELNDVAGLLADSRPQRTRVLTEKGLSYWMETRDLRWEGRDRYREIIEGHVEKIYDNIKQEKAQTRSRNCLQILRDLIRITLANLIQKRNK